MLTPIAEMIYGTLVQASNVMKEYVPAWMENVDAILPPSPTNLMDALDQYEMVKKEKSNYIGIPTKAMVCRWVKILHRIHEFMSVDKKHQSHYLFKESEVLADIILKMIGK